MPEWVCPSCGGWLPASDGPAPCPACGAPPAASGEEGPVWPSSPLGELDWIPLGAPAPEASALAPKKARGGGRRWRAALAGLGAALLVAAGLGGVGLALDLDLDGRSTWRELRSGTVAWDGDTDGDRLEDGWESSRGLDPLQADSDRDGVADEVEVSGGTDPRVGDSDGDGLGDADEGAAADCDGDAFPAPRDSDDDGDGRQDGREEPRDRCLADADGDGVLDGAEGNDACVRRADCDGDGIPDRDEESPFDPLDPDSLDAGVADEVSRAFLEAGQAPGRDEDRDGIPDGWEDGDGLIGWGAYDPAPGRPDLLIEFVRVVGPDSARFLSVDFEPAYEAVADTFAAERGVLLQWQETVVRLDAETDPPIVPTADDPYYASVLRAAEASRNPYVTTVVLNPQHDQSVALHSGIAPIRGMLAAVDYGSHVQVEFETPDGEAVTLYPVLESVVRGDRQDLVRELGFDVGVLRGGEIRLLSFAEDFTVSWRPSWFRTAPRVEFDDGTSWQLNRTGARLDEADLAQTLLHELGHTLGLCHAHETSCNAAFSAADRRDQEESTMSYESAPGTLHFLGSEWTLALEYLACPPQGPVTSLARGEDAAALLEEKYGYSNREVFDLELRKCNDFEPRPREFSPGEPPEARFTLPASLAAPGGEAWGAAPAVAGAAAALAAAAAAGFLVARRVRRAVEPATTSI